MSIDELSIIRTINRFRKISPKQLNSEFETDAEIISVGDQVFAITTDTLCEEASLGLVKDLYSIGWISVLMSISDIAAVGANPLGVLLTLNVPDHYSEEHIRALYSGVEDCCQQHNTFVLGGDTNIASELSIGTTCLGKCNNNFSTRTGYKPGDFIYLSGEAGLGNLTGFLNTQLNPKAEEIEKIYLRKSPLHLGRIIAKTGGSCIDTSDGLIFSLAQLYRNLPYGFEICAQKIPFSPAVIAISSALYLPKFLFVLGQVGDYELLFTIPEDSNAYFKSQIESLDTKVSCIGRVTEERHFIFNHNNERLSVNLDNIQNRLNQVKEPTEYIKTAMNIVSEIGIE